MTIRILRLTALACIMCFLVETQAETKPKVQKSGRELCVEKNVCETQTNFLECVKILSDEQYERFYAKLANESQVNSEDLIKEPIPEVCETKKWGLQERQHFCANLTKYSQMCSRDLIKVLIPEVCKTEKGVFMVLEEFISEEEEYLEKSGETAESEEAEDKFFEEVEKRAVFKRCAEDLTWKGC